MNYRLSDKQMNTATETASVYDLKHWEKELTKRGVGERELRRYRRLLYREFVDGSTLEWPEDVNLEFNHLKLIDRQDSKVDGASKLLFETVDGKKVETVILRISTGRTSLCVSSQVGCTEKCTFCATGAMGFFRNLTKDEILDQVVQAGRILAAEGRSPRNIVFMGMGEPLRNYENLSQSIDLLVEGRAFQFAHKFITVSSSGIADLMLQFAKDYPKVSLALSLNASNDQVRQEVMPINERFPMLALKETLKEIEVIRDGETMIEYIMFDNLNDSLEAAKEVADYLEGLAVHVNLIPYNIDWSIDRRFLPSPLERIVEFQDYLKERGYKVTRRFSLGQDIAAACGQLANKETK